MTTFTVPLEPNHPPVPEPTAPGARAISWQGVRTIAVLELRQRIRSTRWRVALGVWFGLVGLISLLIGGAFAALGGDPTWAFGLVLMFVLGLGLVVAPTLASTAINGDRNAGTLAILQVTLLSPADIAVGKLLAGWAAALAFLTVSLPFLLWSALLGGTTAGGFVLSLVVLALLLGVVCAIGLGFSALTARTAGSSVLTYVAVASLTVISLILFVLTFPAVTTTEQVQVHGIVEESIADGGEYRCETFTDQREVTHTEQTWWLLAINPFVILADTGAQPGLDPDRSGPFEAIRAATNQMRSGPPDVFEECWLSSYAEPRVDDAAPVWPWGLGANLLLGAAGLAVAIRRLRVPYRTLPGGTRVA
ncbi:ABC transporter permease [Occultella gossypii]|uniref:ABC transporter permease subunit n=1 Tax=Occultella gossypii TaxID=2800820 RepID=A0ABS7SAR8_9MICO|nr:ABC transporter permease subunit [Occultella gossypii]MBZ2197362.1 ABC transporter permease subunit [Occultella gossypii]